MKQLLGMAREKNKETPKPPSFNKQLNLNKVSQQYQPQPSSDQEVYEVTEQQLLGYAQFLGIQLPEEEYLMWIAQEGICAQLPEGWATEESPEDGEIVYVNLRNNQRSFLHPCDQHYKQLVLQQRRKRGGAKGGLQNKSMGQGSNQLNYAKQMAMQQPMVQSVQPKPVVVDPLVKMQQQKQQRRLQEQKKKEYEVKKKSIQSRHEQKKEDFLKELKQKEQKTQKKYREELGSQKEKQMKKMSEKERVSEQTMAKELKKYEEDTKRRIERDQDEKRRRQKQAIETKIKLKKDEIKRELEVKLKKGKKEIDDEFKQKVKILDEKEKQLSSETESIDSLLEGEIQKMKNQIIRKKMKEHSEKLRLQTEKQKEVYQQELHKVQVGHDQKIAEIQKKEPKNRIKIDELIMECEREEKEELEAFRYQLEHMRKAKQFEKEERLEELKSELQDKQRKALAQLNQQFNVICQKYKNVKNQEYQNYIWQAQKRSKQEYLRSLKTLEKKYQCEQQIVMIQNSQQDHNNLQRESITKLESMIDNASWQQKQARRELQSLRLQIQNLRSQNVAVGGKLNDNQMKLYQLIQDKIKSR